MSKWGQDAARVSDLRERRESDYQRWKDLDSHNTGWVNRIKLAVQHIPKGSSVLELGAGHAFMRDLIDASCSYQAADIVAHQPDFLVIDLNKPYRLPQRYDVIVALGVFEYVFDVAAALERLKGSAKRIIFTYCCHVPSNDSDLRMRQGWLSDLNERALDAIIDEKRFEVRRKSSIQDTAGFKQIMYVIDTDNRKDH